MVPLTPGGARVQQALLVKVFAGRATTATVAAYPVGQQIAIAGLSFLLGLAAIVTVCRVRFVQAGHPPGRRATTTPLPRERAAH